MKLEEVEGGTRSAMPRLERGRRGVAEAPSSVAQRRQAGLQRPALPLARHFARTIRRLACLARNGFAVCRAPRMRARSCSGRPSTAQSRRPFRHTRPEASRERSLRRQGNPCDIPVPERDGPHGSRVLPCRLQAQRLHTERQENVIQGQPGAPHVLKADCGRLQALVAHGHLPVPALPPALRPRLGRTAGRRLRWERHGRSAQ